MKSRECVGRWMEVVALRDPPERAPFVQVSGASSLLIGCLGALANSYPAIPAEHSRAPLFFRVTSAGRVIRWEAELTETPETSRFLSHLLVVSVSQT